MDINFKLLLHERVRSQCLPIYENGHYKHAALEAMTLVEQTLTEKTGLDIKSAVALSKSIFNGKNSIQLTVPFGHELQDQASRLFQASFAYYRNYAAHDGSKLDSKQCLRILVLASELLDLINASKLRYEPLRKLIDRGVFPNDESALKLLKLLDGYTMPKGVYDGFFWHLTDNGYSSKQMEALIDVGLIIFKSTDMDIPPGFQNDNDNDVCESFELTALGRSMLKGISPI